MTPSTVPAPERCSCLCVRSSTGASALHGVHHEAQKFSTTTFPRSPATDCVPSPPSTGSVLLGAGGNVPAATACSIESSVERETSP